MYCMRLWLLLFFPLSTLAQYQGLYLSYENDYFAQTDKYYTQGVKLGYASSTWLQQKDTVANSYRIIGIGIERLGYTPSSITIQGIPFGTRPYAAITTAHFFMYKTIPEYTVKYSHNFGIGLMGPVVGGYNEQTAIHKAINDKLPLGWEYQIDNTFILQYGGEVHKQLFKKPYAQLLGTVQLQGGTLHANGSGILTMRLGKLDNYFAVINPIQSTQTWYVYVTAQLIARGVWYNGTMQGSLFNDRSIYTLSSLDVTNTIGAGSYGITFGSKKIQFAYNRYFISPEYRGGAYHGWGQLLFRCFY
jgi:lipid A 3-O-deacylase